MKDPHHVLAVDLNALELAVDAGHTDGEGKGEIEAFKSYFGVLLPNAGKSSGAGGNPGLEIGHDAKSVSLNTRSLGLPLGERSRNPGLDSTSPATVLCQTVDLKNYQARARHVKPMLGHRCEVGTMHVKEQEAGDRRCFVEGTTQGTRHMLALDRWQSEYRGRSHQAWNGHDQLLTLHVIRSQRRTETTGQGHGDS